MYFNLRYVKDADKLSIMVLNKDEERAVIKREMLNMKISRGRGSYDYFCIKEEVRDFLISEGLEKFLY